MNYWFIYDTIEPSW